MRFSFPSSGAPTVWVELWHELSTPRRFGWQAAGWQLARGHAKFAAHAVRRVHQLLLRRQGDRRRGLRHARGKQDPVLDRAARRRAGRTWGLGRIGAVEKTTNEAFARKLLGDAAKERLALYSGSGAYDRMLEELVAERIDGALMDKPYAFQKVPALRESIGAELALTDIAPEMMPGIELEKMGFAVRKTDRALAPGWDN